MRTGKRLAGAMVAASVSLLVISACGGGGSSDTGKSVSLATAVFERWRAARGPQAGGLFLPVRRAEPARNEGRERSLDRVCEPGGVAASLARIRLF